MIVQRKHDGISRIAAIGITAAMTLSAFSVLPQTASATNRTQQQTIAQTAASTDQSSDTTRQSHDVIAIAFQENWDSVAKECTQVYGPEGVGYVQVSPPEESITGSQWWTSYQPVSYKIDSKLGTEDQFKSMIATCKAAGVGIIADAVINHMAGTYEGDSRTGTAGSAYDGNGSFPEVPYTTENFHTCTDNISNYQDAGNVQNCRLTGLQDLDTSSAYVQDKISDYLKYLLDLGVYGFRVDAVKHIANADVSAIKAQLAQKSGRDADDIYFEQEVIGNASEAAEIQPANYLGNGKVSEFNFTNHLSTAFSGDIADENNGLATVGSDGWIQSDKAAVFVTNWDTERSNALTYKKGSKYLLANAFMLANDYGQPHIYSGYYFDNNDDGAPGAKDASVPDVSCPTNGSMTSGTWQCAERWTAIRGMIGFHNAVAGQTKTDWKNYDANVLGFSRGKVGYLALNNSDKDSHQTFQTSLPAGTYCNVYTTGDCSQTVSVGTNGTFDATLSAHSAIALYDGAQQNQWTGTNKTDPTDPDLSQFDSSVQPITDTSRTVYYQKPASWSQAQMLYTTDGWASQATVDMTDAGSGWYQYTLDPKGGDFQFVFTDGTNNWDNPNGSGGEGNNYSAQGHWTTVSNHTATAGIPGDVQPYKPKTKVIVHYKAADSIQRGIYMWATDKDGDTLASKQYDFTGTDSYGQVFEKTIDGAYNAGDIGVIVTSADWDKVGGDRKIDGSTGTAEIWVDGSQPDTTLNAAPDEYAKKPTAINVTVHYHRSSDDYASEDGMKTWDIWGWSDSANGSAAAFTSHDKFGLISKYTVNGSKASFKLRYGGDAWEQQDPQDRVIPQSAMTMNADGTADAEVWLVQDDQSVYTNGTLLVTSAMITKAEISDFTTITAKLNKQASSVSADEVTLNDANVASVKADGTTLTITTKKDLDVTKPYTLSITGFGDTTVKLGAVVRCDAFDAKYAYDGDDLGASVDSKQLQTSFKLWAPTATSVKLNVYKDTSVDGKLDTSTAMKRGKKGVWSATAPKSDIAYDFTLTFADGTVNQSADPYAKAAVVNGKRSVALADGDTAVKGSGQRMKAFGNTSDAVIAETNIRDFSIKANSGIDAKKQGKYLGMIQTGTKTTDQQAVSGLDYIKKLGVTHLQIMPMYDYGSVDETTDLSYNDTNANGAQNWGYDPVNYDVPEGSYSSDPANPSTRVKELKQMVKGLHDNDIRVIMDVVYNHVQDASTHSFNQTVPGYYFRYDANGNLVSNSGCGNDTASERAMMSKYIVDSVTYWAKNYNVDGFRFDLMGLIDTQTMIKVRKALDAIDPSIIVLGEGWDMNTTMDKSLMTIQANGTAVAPKDGDNGISFFNDSIRDGLKGSVFSDMATGFVSGDIDSADGSKKGKERLIANNLLACPTSDTANDTDLCNGGDANYGAPGQLVQYAEIHDNMTLYDKLLKSVPKQEGMSDDEYAADIVARAKLTDSAVMLAQGTTAIQLGQEFLRTKNGDGNSYKSGDGANAIDWNRSVEQADSVVYVRGLIALRKAIGSMHASSYEEIAKNMTITQQDNGVVAYQLTNGNDKYVVILNANDAAVGVSSNVVPSGEYTTLVAQGTVLALPASTKTKVMANSMEKTSTASRLTRSAQTDLDVVVGDGGYEAAGLSATVLKATTQGGSPVVPISPENPDQPDTGDGSDNGQTAGQDGNAAHGIADTGAPVVAVVVVALLLLASGCVISVTAKGRRS